MTLPPMTREDVPPLLTVSGAVLATQRVRVGHMTSSDRCRRPVGREKNKKPRCLIFGTRTIIHDPTLLIHDPTLLIHDPTLLIHDPTLLIHDPTLLIHDPTLLIHDPTLLIHDPTLLLQSAQFCLSGSEQNAITTDSQPSIQPDTCR